MTRSARILGVPIDADGRPRGSPSAPGARPGSPTGCSAGCGTTSRCAAEGASPPRRRWRARRVRRRRARPGQGRPSHSGRAVPALRRPAGRAHHAGAVHRRGARHRSRTPTSPTCSSRGCSSARPGAGSRGTAGLGPPRARPRWSPRSSDRPRSGRTCAGAARVRRCRSGSTRAALSPWWPCPRPRSGRPTGGPGAGRDRPRSDAYELRPPLPSRPSPSDPVETADRGPASGRARAGRATGRRHPRRHGRPPRLLRPATSSSSTTPGVGGAAASWPRPPAGARRCLLVEPMRRRFVRVGGAGPPGRRLPPATLLFEEDRRQPVVGGGTGPSWGIDDGRRRSAARPAVVERAGTHAPPALIHRRARRSRALPDGLRHPYEDAGSGRRRAPTAGLRFTPELLEGRAGRPGPRSPVWTWPSASTPSGRSPPTPPRST